MSEIEPIKIMSLKYVPDDELAEIEALFKMHEVDYYLTHAGVFGTALPALWLKQKNQLTKAQNLLLHYQQNRQRQAKIDQQKRKAEGLTFNFWQCFLGDPIRYLAYLIAVLLVLLISFLPIAFL